MLSEWFKMLLLKYCLVTCVGAYIALSPVYADVYTVGTTATINDMTSETESTTPADRTRTTIGIAEIVVCRISSNTWQDCDYNETTQQMVSDTIGDRTWSKTGSESANCTLAPPTGDSSTLTASKSPGSVTVTVTIHDSHTKYDDTTIEKTKAFTIIAPSSQTYSLDSNNPPWTSWSSGTKYLGAKSMFNATVQPTTVTFYYADLRENFGSGETDTWPDGSTWYGPTGPFPFSINQANEWAPDDTQSTGLYDSNKLYTGSVWQDFSPSVSIPLQYQNASGTWVTFYTPTATRNYYQSNRKSRVGVGGVTGSSQGPWQGP